MQGPPNFQFQFSPPLLPFFTFFNRPLNLSPPARRQLCAIKNIIAMTRKIQRVFYLITSITLAIFAHFQMKAQAPQHNLVLFGKATEQGNLLRWAPTNYALWKACSQGGYALVRYDWEAGKGILPKTEQRISPAPFKPMSLEQMKAKFKPEDKLAAVAAQALYGQAIPPAGAAGFEAIVAQATQEENLFGFAMLAADASPEVADALALRWNDATAMPGKRYVYRLHTLAKIEGEKMDTAWFHLNPKFEVPVPAVQSLVAEEGEHLVTLTWDNTENIFPPSGYYIERSDDKGRTWKRLNDQPHIAIQTSADSTANASFKVPMAENYQPAQFRVLAFNAFGEMGLDSKIISAMGRDKTPPPSPILEQPVHLDRNILLSWKMPEEVGDLRGFFVGFASNAEGPFMAISKELAPNQRQWTDLEAGARGDYHYYIISAIDTAGNLANSLAFHSHFVDSIGPAKPLGLKATVDSIGLLTLTWQRGSEPDLAGYNVFFANRDDHEFIQLNVGPLEGDTFRHALKLKTLTEEIYYKIVAVDQNGNPSPFSDKLRVKKPDVIPPVAPVLRNVEASDKGVSLRWTPSPSHDVASFQLYRRPVENGEWKMQLELPASQLALTDTTARAGVLYEYYLVAKDDDGLRSVPSASVTARAYHNASPKGLDRFTLQGDKERMFATLSWLVPSDQATQVFVYKAADDGDLRLLTSLQGIENQFIDEEIEKGKRYRYAVKLAYPTGAESALSETKEVRF